ncbi:GspH/FimT family pseudopilin [Rhodoferax sediminis]|jgi:type IV fimbrial biogenesis protein FimT|uniref:Type II secretion system protein H n=1 Tax=Rhodoferax sediminis TaxID=2509614 RepID=A0A515DH08_9BURK|nr:GspH/FimT family pseudopilin [Rhodoferax sediminis]QDL39690.1 prepilin-type N-terminal cleavage/methylation domain-containing protein [Rhodoferax sediminis]
MNRRLTADKGFTLIELMVTVTLVAIALALGVPSFTTFQRNAELTSATNSLIAALNAARGEAMKRGRYAMVVPTDGANWNSGWVVFVDVDRTGSYTANDLTILTQEPPPSYLTVTPTPASSLYIMYDASGYSKTTTGSFGAWTFEIARNDVAGTGSLAQTRRIKIASTGRVRVCTPKTPTDTRCSASASQL